VRPPEATRLILQPATRERVRTPSAQSEATGARSKEGREIRLSRPENAERLIERVDLFLSKASLREALATSLQRTRAVWWLLGPLFACASQRAMGGLSAVSAMLLPRGSGQASGRARRAPLHRHCVLSLALELATLWYSVPGRGARGPPGDLVDRDGDRRGRSDLSFKTRASVCSLCPCRPAPSAVRAEDSSALGGSPFHFLTRRAPWGYLVGLTRRVAEAYNHAFEPRQGCRRSRRRFPS
jgi:hypothetical protein